MQLTDQKYWERYLNNITLPARVENFNITHFFVISNILKKYLAPNKNALALEVGCAPGRWMVFLAENFGYHVDGCELLQSASRKTEENLKLCKIENFNIYTGDFLELNLGKERYDVIISLGFIEHFNNPDLVIKKHVDLLKRGGILIIGWPKFTGLNYFIARQVDKYADIKLLQNHNLSIMNKNYLNQLEINSKKLFVNTIGGFEPGFFNLSRMPTWKKCIFYMIKLIFSNEFFRKLNWNFCSRYLIGVYKKI